MEPLKCDVTLTCQYFPQISLLDAFLPTSTHINYMRVKVDVEDSIG